MPHKCLTSTTPVPRQLLQTTKNQKMPNQKNVLPSEQPKYAHISISPKRNQKTCSGWFNHQSGVLWCHKNQSPNTGKLIVQCFPSPQNLQYKTKNKWVKIIDCQYFQFFLFLFSNHWIWIQFLFFYILQQFIYIYIIFWIMQNAILIHNCLAFEYKKQKFIYGLTLTLLNTNFLIKYKPQYIIVPSNAYIYGLFSHAALQYIIKIIIKLVNKSSSDGSRQNKTPYSRQSLNRETSEVHILDKVMRYAKLILIQAKRLQSSYPRQLIQRLLEAGSTLPLTKFEFKQEELINKIISKLNKQVRSSTNRVTQQSGKSKAQLQNWLNCPLYQLKIIIPELGTSTYLCQGSEIIVVDPSEQFVIYLNNNYTIKSTQGKEDEVRSGRLLALLHTVIITKISSVLAVLSLMIVNGVEKVRVLVLSEDLQRAIIEKARKYLQFPQEVVRSRLIIRNIAHFQSQNSKYSYRYPILAKNMSSFTLQSPNSLTCIYYPLSNQNPSRIQIHFGSSINVKQNKRIVFYTPTPSQFPKEISLKKQLQLSSEFELTHFPKQISEQNVQLLILYKVEQQLMKQLKSMPQQIRKKIILNRLEHKYHHKYFITLEKNKIQHCSISNMQYINILTQNRLTKAEEKGKNILVSLEDGQFRSKNLDISFQRVWDVMPGCKVYQMGNNAQIQTIGQIVSIYDGFIQAFARSNEKENITSQIIGVKDLQKGEVLKKVCKIRALKYSLVKIIMQSDYQIQQNDKQIEKFLKKKLIRPLSHNINVKSTQQTGYKKRQSSEVAQHIETIQNNSLINSLTTYQKQKLNKICHPVTFQVGFKTNNKNSHVYFISKGGMKWQDNDQLAGNSDFIGDLLSYYTIRQKMQAKQKGQKTNKNNKIMNEGQLELDNFIEVIKDTWALEINIEQFHKYFILQNPHLLHLILTKGKIFN